MPVEAVSGGVRIRLHIQPRAGRTELAGLFGDAIKIRLMSPPVDGAANEELIRFLAELFDVPRSNVELVAGHSGRKKAVRVSGLDVAWVRGKLGLLKPNP